MDLWQLAVITGTLIVVVLIIAWLVLRPKPASKTVDTSTHPPVETTIKEDVDAIFNDKYRDELRNRGRLHFEKVLSENAMFLQQDLRLTASQLNDYMKDEIKRILQDEFAKYEESISDAKDLALNTIQKTQAVMEQQREVLQKQMTEQADKEKAQLLAHFEKNMADIINHYILAAIGDEIDLTNQLDFIFKNLEENKKAIIEDIKSGT